MKPIFVIQKTKYDLKCSFQHAYAAKICHDYGAEAFYRKGEQMFILKNGEWKELKRSVLPTEDVPLEELFLIRLSEAGRRLLLL